MNYELPFMERSTILQVSSSKGLITLNNITIEDVSVDCSGKFTTSKKYDGVFTEYVNRITWSELDAFLESCYNSIEFGCYAVFLVRCNESVNTRYPTGRPEFSVKLITEILHSVGFREICITHTQEADGKYMMVRGYKSSLVSKETKSELIKWNLGSFTVQYKDGWNNADIIDLREWSKANGFNFVQMNVAKPLPMSSNSVDLIKCDHLLEHLDRKMGVSFLKECHRVLVGEGVIRIGIPDTRILASKYLEGKISDFASINEGVKNASDDAEAFYNIATAGHMTFHDEDSVRKALMDAGFIEVSVMAPGKSWSDAILKETKDSFPMLSCIVEARKSKTSKPSYDVSVGKPPDSNTEPIYQYLAGKIKEGVQ